MPLIVVSGLPSSGKSGAAAALADVCRALGQDVVVVDEESLHLRRNDSYKGSTWRCCRRHRRQCLFSEAGRAGCCPHRCSTIQWCRCNI